MPSANINVRIDSELKARAQTVLADLGLDMTTAINVFISQIVFTQSIPFLISKPKAMRPKLGGWEGKIAMAPDFNEPMEEFRDYV